MKRSLLLGLSLVVCFCVADTAPRAADEKPARKKKKEQPAYAPTASYDKQDIEGWTVYVSAAFVADQKEIGDETLKLVAAQLYQITRVVPPRALAKIQKTPIWVEAESSVVAMCYHPSKQWLIENGFNPAKEKSVELGNPKNFLSWTIHQPWMVFHELAHAYHDRELGWERKEIVSAYDKAVEAKLYESVLKYNGKNARAYALNNPKEYFAEQSEAYFGTNDFYPFVKAELQQHDPEMVKVLKKVWEL